jgi:hypothetical protein
MTNYVLALDPGGTTGWALGAYSDLLPLNFVDGGQITAGVNGFVAWFTRMSWMGGMSDDSDVQIVSESFTLRPAVKFPDVTPLRIEGALSALLGPDGVRYQTPATKALVPDSELRRLGFWIPGQRHQMDARIHALAYMMKTHYMPTLETYFGEQ